MPDRMFFDRIAVSRAASGNVLVKVWTALATRDWRRKRPLKSHAVTNMLSLRSIRKDAPLEICQFDGSKRIVYAPPISALT